MDALDFWLQKINPTWSTSLAMGTIVERQVYSDRVVSLKIRCNRHMHYGVAGQHHPVMIELNGRRYERTYSLTRLDSSHVLLTLKQLEGGVVSTYLSRDAKIGDVIQFGLPYGDMLIEVQPNKKLLILAAGSGITPMYSMLYALAEKHQLQHYQIQLMYWAQHHEDFAFKTQFELWQKHYPDFEVAFFATQDTPKAARLNQQHLDKIIALEQTTVLACGSAGFVAQAQTLCSAAQSIQAEAFSMNLPVESDVGEIQVTLTRSKQIVTIPKGQPILLGLEQAHIKPMHGCRMGICNKCSCRKVEGATKNLNDHTENNEPHQDLRICVNSAKNDLILDL